MEESGVGESASNAHVERAIWEVEGMARTLIFAAEEAHGVKTELDHPLRLWAIEYAGQLLSRCQRSTRDGRTAYELRKGRPYRRALPCFGEPVLYLKVAPGKRRRKYEDRWETAVYVGLVDRSNEVRVCSPAGAFRVNNIRRLPPGQRRDPELIRSIRGHALAASARGRWRSRGSSSSGT